MEFEQRQKEFVHMSDVACMVFPLALFDDKNGL
jgi:hypothetical protein